MKVNGIIAEYNPFHNGHKYHMEDAKKRTGADYTIVVMSGNFVQRGAPALVDKFKRARMALSCGADLVLELPICFSVSSAEYFATGAVALLDKLGVVDHLCFGSESGELAPLQKIAHILANEPVEYTEMLRTNLRMGYSYPNARTTALIQYDSSISMEKDTLSSPNNILGIEYLKVLERRKSAILPDTTLRMGSDYRDKRLGENPCSALALRQAILAGQDVDFLKEEIPENAYRILADSLKDTEPVSIDDFSAQLHYKLLLERSKGYCDYLDVSPELSVRIQNSLENFRSYLDFCDRLKSKDMTYVRISRCLLHILLNLDCTTIDTLKAMDYAPYARVLGFRREASPLLAAIKEKTSVPVITKLADAKKQLTQDALSVLEKELCMNDIYLSVAALKNRKPMINEYSTPVEIL
ncbi:MAG: nucleotidyltransferase [Bacteroidales bacterium]|nr:nucleotidyltransferase [Lachnoclostridium sp.]MCM1384612.1 nucleotidyltransferase [Lachnoclostridium sp.]MCM1463849.1 nucleotidyltransferase [Bacteroidales bacterium]